MHYPAARHGGWLSAIFALVTLVVAMQAWGLGTRIPNQDPKAVGRGNAFAATADNPAAIYYNPAGISQLEEHNIQVGGLLYMNIYAEHIDPNGIKTENQTSPIFVPQIHYVYSPTDRAFSFGLGVYAPFGLAMEWPSDASFRNTGIEARLTYVTVNPVVAWEPMEGLAFAVGPTFNYSNAELRQGLPASLFGAGAEARVDGSDWAFGFNAGVLWQPHPKWSFGAKYFSGTKLEYDGDGILKSPFISSASSTETHLDFPQIAVLGVSFRPTTNWNIEINIDWTDWDVTDAAVIEGLPFPLPRPNVYAFNWRSSFFYEIGVTRQLGKGYYVSAGYFFSEASMPDDDYTPLVPDTDLHVGSLGVGFDSGRWHWAVAAQFIGGPSRDIDNKPDPRMVNGQWTLFTPTISASVGYNF